MSDTTDNPTTLQNLIDSQYNLLTAEQTLYAALQTKLTALSTPDVSSISNNGEGGSESYAVATIMQELSESSARIKELREQLLELFKMYNDRFMPTFGHRRLRVGGQLR